MGRPIPKLSKKSRTPKKIPANQRVLTREDGYTSLITGLNTSRDKRATVQWFGLRTFRQEQEELWRTNDLAAKAVEIFPDEMTRKGFEVKIAADQGEDSDVASKSVQRADDAPAGAPPKAPPGYPGGDPLKVVPPPPSGPKMQDHTPPRPTSPLQTSLPTVSKASATKKLAEQMGQWWMSLDGNAATRRALEYARAYGGAMMILGIDDGAEDLREPLNEDAIRSFDFVNIITPREAFTVAYYTNPRLAKYGKPAIWRIMPEMLAGPAATSGNWNGTAAMDNPALQIFEIHETRVITFVGTWTSHVMRREHAGWGDSIFNRVEKVLRDFGLTWETAAALIADFAQGVFTLDGLAEALATKGEQAIIDRIAAMDKARSMLRAVVLDKADSFERKPTPVSGLPELLDRFMMRLAAALDIPVTRLMGRSAAGLNSTGDAEVRGFYDYVSSEQTAQLRPHLQRMFHLGFKAKLGPAKGKVPANWDIHFNPLWQLDDLQESQRRLNIAQADHIYATDGMASPEEIGASRFGGDDYSIETTLDFEGREQVATAREEQQTQAAQAQRAATTQVGPAVTPDQKNPTPMQVPPAKQPIDVPRGASQAANDRADHIEERDGKFVVLSQDRSKELGTYATRAEAEERLRQVEHFKDA